MKSHNSDTNLIRKTDSPAFTPKLSKHRHRQNSEPDLENARQLQIAFNRSIVLELKAVME